MASVVQVNPMNVPNPALQMAQIANATQRLRLNATRSQLAQQQAQHVNALRDAQTNLLGLKSHLLPGQMQQQQELGQAKVALLQQQAKNSQTTTLQRNLAALDAMQHHGTAPSSDTPAVGGFSPVAQPAIPPNTPGAFTPMNAASLTGSATPGTQVQIPSGQPVGGTSALTGDQPTLGGYPISQLKQALVAKAMGLPAPNPLQPLKNIAAQRSTVSPIVNLVADANNPNLPVAGQQAAAMDYAKKVLSTDDQRVMSGTHTFLPNYNKNVAPYVQHFINNLYSQGIWARGRLAKASFESFMGMNTPLANQYRTTIEMLTDLAGSYRTAGGDRATMGQIKINIHQLTGQIRKGDINGAVETLNHLSKMVYTKGDSVIKNSLRAVKNSYPSLQRPVQIVLPGQDSKLVKMVAPNGAMHHVPRANIKKARSLGWREE